MRDAAEARSGREVHTLLEGSNDDAHWCIEDGSAIEVTEQYRIIARAALWQHYVELLYPLLDDKAVSITLIDTAKNGERDDYVIKVTSKDKPDFFMSFDKKTHFLTKIKCQTPGNGRDELVWRESLYSDYKEHDGIPTASHVIHFVDGKKYMDLKGKSIEYLTRIDDKLFLQP